MAPKLTVRNISKVPLTLVSVERFNPEKESFQLSTVTLSLAAVTNATGLTNAKTSKPVAPIAPDDTPFATAQPKVKLPPFQVVQTDIDAYVHKPKERLRLTFQTDGGDKYRLNCPVPVSEAARLEGPANAAAQFTGIFIADQSFVALLTAYDLAKWQAKIPDNTPLGALSIPGTHNSPTCFAAPPSVRCQAVGPVEQLKKGARFFDLRLQLPEPFDINTDRLLLVHSVFPISLLAPKYFRDLYNDILKYLSENPTETLILSLKREGTGKGTDEQLSQILKKHYTNPKQWYTEPRLPTLGEVRGRIVLFRRFILDPPLRAEWGGRGWGINATGWADNTANATCTGGDVCIQDFYEVMSPASITKKIEFTEAQFERSGACCFDAKHHGAAGAKFPLYVNFLTASNFWNVGTWPEKIAGQVNPAILQYLLRQHMVKPDGGLKEGDWSTGIAITDWVGVHDNWDLFRAIVGMNRRHDISNVTYGHFGLPSYHADTQQWTFPRNIAQTWSREGGGISLRRIHRRVHSLDPAIAQIPSLSSAEAEAEAEAPFKSRHVLKDTPELLPASALIKALGREASLGGVGPEESAPPAITNSQLVFGRAPYADARNYRVSSSQLPFLAVVSSRESDKISFWPVLSMTDVSTEEDIEAPDKLPVLGSLNTWSAPLNEPILQLCYLPVACVLAYRQSSASSLCLPFIQPTRLHGQAHPRVVIKQVLSLPLSRTGGHAHADVALSCAPGLQMAVVDVHGNYSVWEVTGKQSLTSRLLYQARLRFSGKLCSWTESQRPPRQPGPYFDGWHKVCFLEPSIGYPLLLVANRQKAVLFDNDGNELQDVDLRLESKFEWLLDISPSKTDPDQAIDDDDDYDLFIVEDDDVSEAGPDQYHIDSWARRQPNTGKDWSWIYQAVDNEDEVLLNNALEHAETQLHSSADIQGGTPLLSELTPAFQVDDIEEAEKSLVVWRQNASDDGHVIRSVFPEAESFGRVYEQTIERFVRPLSDNVLNRLRVKTERLSRQVAMDLTLASLVIDQGMQAPAPAQSSIEHAPLDEPQQKEALALDIAMSRLSKYKCFVDHLPAEPAPSSMANVLAHLPDDMSADPDEYSYSSIELDLARKRLQSQEVDPAVKRRAERMEAIRRQRAEKAQATGKITLSQETPILVRDSSPVGQELGLTQPERGDFGTRPLPGVRSAKRKRHSQRAGF
ncbi:hypothetical protein DV738_g3439, partial [Chaetothyriales sp. CBS 135597]